VEILGRLETGLPFALEFGAQSTIGSIAWHQSGQTGIEPGFHTTNFVFEFPDVVPPPVGLFPASGTIDGVFYNYLLETGDYNLASLAMSGGEKMLVRGSSRLDISGNATLSGNSYILILPSAKLQLYVGGTANLRGNGIINQGAPLNFMYVGTGANQTLNLRVTTPFVGIIYAPTRSAPSRVAEIQRRICREPFSYGRSSWDLTSIFTSTKGCSLRALLKKASSSFRRSVVVTAQ
jgi:hypothetical protein